MVAVLDEVQVADPVDVDRRHRLALPLSQVDPLPALAHPRRGGPEGAVELARAVDGADDRVERDQLLAEPAFADAPERLHHLLEREDVVHVVRAAEARGQPRERAPAARPAEVELGVRAGEACVPGRHSTSVTRRWRAVRVRGVVRGDGGYAGLDAAPRA